MYSELPCNSKIGNPYRKLEKSLSSWVCIPGIYIIPTIWIIKWTSEHSDRLLENNLQLGNQPDILHRNLSLSIPSGNENTFDLAPMSLWGSFDTLFFLNYLDLESMCAV